MSINLRVSSYSFLLILRCGSSWIVVRVNLSLPNSAINLLFRIASLYFIDNVNHGIERLMSIFKTQD